MEESQTNIGNIMDNKNVYMEYREWLIKRLIHADPEVTKDFREMYMTKSLVPDDFEDHPHLVDTIKGLRDEILEYGSFEEGIKELAKKEGKEIVPSMDGITHINVYSKGATKLGRALSNFAPIGFTHPTFGKCDSVEGLYYFLATGRLHPHLKGLSGYKAKEEGRKYDRVHDDNFIPLIKEAITFKITQNEKLKEAFKNSTLPFRHYYFYGDKTNPKIIPMDTDTWMIDHLTQLRLMLNGQPVDISFFQ